MPHKGILRESDRLAVQEDNLDQIRKRTLKAIMEDERNKPIEEQKGRREKRRAVKKRVSRDRYEEVLNERKMANAGSSMRCVRLVESRYSCTERDEHVC